MVFFLRNVKRIVKINKKHEIKKNRFYVIFLCQHLFGELLHKGDSTSPVVWSDFDQI